MRADQAVLDLNQLSTIPTPTTERHPDREALWSGCPDMACRSCPMLSSVGRDRRGSKKSSMAPYRENLRESQKKGSLTPSVRKRHMKLLLNNSFSNALSAQTHGVSFQEDTDWALYPMEHAWMLSAVEGSYETILDFISVDPHLLTRRDFISGYSVLHWLSKRGQDETLIKVLRYAESAGIPVNVNLRGSGGLTPLHVASMHSRYMVIKLLVGAFGANVDAMDYNGKRAWQYLKGDAPREMKELLGAWDDEHNCGCAQNANKNVNNNCGGSLNLTGGDEVDFSGQTGVVNNIEQKTRKSTWPYGSFRKLVSSLSFFGSKT